MHAPLLSTNSASLAMLSRYALYHGATTMSTTMYAHILSALGWLKINGCLAKSACFLEEPLKGPSSCFVKIVSSGSNGTTPAPQNQPDACHACVSSRKVRNKTTRTDYSRDSVEICRVRSGNSFTIPRLVILWALSGSSSRSMSDLHLGGTSAPSRRDSRESDRV